MLKIRRYWSQNRKKIISTILMLAAIFLIIQLLNYWVKHLPEEERDEELVKFGKPMQSAIYGDIVSEEKTDENVNIVQKFIEFCNKKKTKEAFSLLTDDCKEQLFNNSLEMFIKNYHDILFETAKTFNIKLWINTENSYTYEILLYNDNLLATGGSQMEENIVEYITVINGENGKSLNIRGFIEKQNINKSLKKDEIEIIVDSKNVYEKYEEYNISINNTSSKSIKIGNRSDSDSIIILNENEVMFSSFIYEMDLDELVLDANQQRNIKIRFNKIYDRTNTINKIIFKEISKFERKNDTEYEEYIEDIENMEDVEKISIEIDI